jgi:D-alanine--D-alanine ligase
MRKREEIQSAFALREELEGRHRFFLVGIGGAGMSALARMLATRGYKVAGTDSTLSPEVERLRAEGFAVEVGHSTKAVARFGAEGAAMVLTDAIDLDASPEVAAARQLGLPLFRRSQALGWLLRDYKVIAVTGTHGKTTTTGLTGAGLIAAGMDPLVVVGAAIPEWGGPVREGKGEWAVVEACEAYDAFHDLDPTLVILTNLELDHVDFHGSYEHLRASVLRFVDRIPESGRLVYCAADAGASEVAELTRAPSLAYGGEGQLSNSDLALPGEHNRLNAEGALMAARFLRDQNPSLDVETARGGIASFGGAERRLQILLDGEIAVVDDYAHHPTEIVASLGGLRDRYPDRRLVVVYQPHLYSRTAPLIREFAEALDFADLVVLTDIYPAREEPIPGVSSARIAERLQKPVRYVPSRHQLPAAVHGIVRPGDVVVGMGAGNISEFAPALVERLQNQGRPPRIGVLSGGDSAEREVSILSGRAVAKALRERGHSVIPLDATELLLARASVAALKEIDVAFLAVHGTHAEDGAIQGLLELMGIPYTGSGIQASAIALDKALTKQILAAAGVRVPRGYEVRRLEDVERPSGPVVVKPNAQGSTVGLRFVEDPDDLEAAVANALQYDRSVVIEEWLRGMEISVPVLVDRALPPVEIAPASGRYDFESKYTPGATMEIVPARLDPELRREAERIALQCHRTLRCEGATRTDMIVQGGELFVLEVNTLPGMTSTSLLPNSAASVGIDFGELCERLVEDALRRHGPRS